MWGAIGALSSSMSEIKGYTFAPTHSSVVLEMPHANGGLEGMMLSHMADMTGWLPATLAPNKTGMLDSNSGPRMTSLCYGKVFL